MLVNMLKQLEMKCESVRHDNDKSRHEKFLEDLLYFEKIYDVQMLRLKKKVRDTVEKTTLRIDGFK